MILIVAYDSNRLIGNQGGLPWSIPSDLQHFKKTTRDHVIVMGGTTWRSLGKPLPHRHNIVVTNSPEDIPSPAEGYSDLEDALLRAEEITRENGTEDYFVIGGASIYEQLLPRATRIIATKIWGTFEGDVHFPALDTNYWTGEIYDGMDNVTDGSHTYSVIDYRRV